jgi:hypothetical protein
MGQKRMAVVFSNIVLAVIVGWIAGDAWVRAINNGLYRSCRFNKNSTSQTMMIAFTLTLAAFLLYWSFTQLFAKELHQDNETEA